MNKVTVIGVSAAGILAVAGVKLTELGEYAVVARDRLAEVVSEKIPLSVEIDRMELLVRKLDDQVQSQAAHVADALVALENSETKLAETDNRCDNLLCELASLRDACDHPTQYVMVKHTCLGSNEEATDVHTIKTALQAKANEWKLLRSERAARTSAVASQRDAASKLSQQFDEWKLQKEVLRQRVESLKARYAAQRLSSQSNTSTIDGADLRRSIELADEIEGVLRASELRDSLSSTGTTNTIMPIEKREIVRSASLNGVLDDVDRILQDNR